MYKNIILNRIIQYCKSNYELINKEDMVLGKLYYNQRCHLNAVQKVKEGKAEKVFLVLTTDYNDTNLIIHFINQNKDGKFVDNTWGWIYETTNYYLVKEIKPEEYNRIGQILEEGRKYLINQHSNYLLRKLFRINNIL